MADKKDKQKKNKKRRMISPSHTKGYYRFSRQFPSVTDADGYRDNDIFVRSKAKRSALRRNLVLLFAVVFVLAFAVSAVCISMSKLPAVIGTQGENTSANDDAKSPLSGYNAVFLSGDVLSYPNADGYARALALGEYNAVVIEFKSPSGYIYFKPEYSVEAEAVCKASSQAAQTVKSFKDAGFAVFASFSCFADDIYARNNGIDAAYILEEPGSGSLGAVKKLWYDGTAEPHAWINPYSYIVTGYLSSLIYEISAMNVDGIIFNSVVLPTGTNSSSLIFDNKLEGENAGVNEKMAEFISYISGRLECKTGIVLSAENMAEMTFMSDAPDILGASPDLIIIDARLPIVPENIDLGENTYLKPVKTPFEFISALMRESSAYLRNNDCDAEIMPILDLSESGAEQLAALQNENISSYMEYEPE